MEQSALEHIKGVIESLLFVNERPITFQQIKEVLAGIETNDIKQSINALKEEYDGRKSGMVIAEIAGGYQMLTNSIYVSYIRSFYKTKHKEKLSKPSLETLAIVAYKQPVTRSDVELIRGVNSDGVMAHLFRKELIKIVGRKDVPGRPYLYGTTKQFLEYFGLKSLSDLPSIEDFPKLEAAVELTQEGPDESTEGEGAPASLEEVEAQQETLEEPQEELELPQEEQLVSEDDQEVEKTPETGESIPEPVVEQASEESIPEPVVEQSPEENVPEPVVEQSTEEPEEKKENINQTFEGEISSSDTVEARIDNESCETSQKD